MSMISAILQGLIQGFTEFLPVSSSGHLSVYQYFTGTSSQTAVLYSLLLHLGTLLAVLIAFWRTIRELIVEVLLVIRDLFTGKLLKTKANAKRRMILLLVVSCVPLLAVLPVKGLIEGLSADNSLLVEGVCFLGTSMVLSLADKMPKGGKNARNMRVGDAVGIGVAQALATLPGLSRSGATISTGLVCGLTRNYAVAYSFILGIPAILAAGLLEAKDLLGASGVGDAALPILPAVVGMVVATVAGLLAIRLVNYLVTSDKFKIFAVYTFLVGLVITGIGLLEISTGNALQHFFIGLIH